jgi:hypothetical protein
MRLSRVPQIFFMALLLWSAMSPIVGRAEDLSKRKPVPVELLVGGDDGLTLRLASALRDAIVASPEFVEADNTSKRPLRLEIPTNVNWHSVRDKTSVDYVVVFTDSDSKYLGGSFNRCWESEIPKCASKVISDLRLALAHRSEAAVP